MRLTILGSNQRVALMAALRKLFGLSMKDTKHIINNLPFRAEHLAYEPAEIHSLFSNISEYSYDKDSTDIITEYSYGVIPEDPEYIAAILWYDGLSVEDKKKVEYLLMHSGPRA